MAAPSSDRFTGAEIVLPGDALDETIAVFTDRLGFRVETISPADRPAAVSMSGHGLRVRLDCRATTAPGLLRISVPLENGELPGDFVAPNGTRIVFADADAPIVIPELKPERVVTRFSKDDAWHAGRAGLQYRDLIPSRLGGRFIASHIRLTEGGLVPDYTHFHKIRFQLIYCVQGWIRVAYEDQGESFVMQTGDCVLQPPRIRHRVLESSAGAAVVEVGCPADHETCADWSMPLPGPAGNPARRFGGQRFVRHVADGAAWIPWRAAEFEARDLGIAGATDGLAGARVVRASGGTTLPSARHDGEFLFLFVQSGKATLHCDGRDALNAGDACTIPSGRSFGLQDTSEDFAFLEVSLPGTLSYAPQGGAA